MSKVYLDGKLVDGSEITPNKHVFVGKFRRPYSCFSGAGYVACDCGHILQTFEESFDHWQAGHWDILQYQTIKSDG